MEIESISDHDTASLEAIGVLFREYASSLGFELDFQNFKEELVNLPGEYSRPNGRILMAREADGPAGCVALRRIDVVTCEMKRLYVRPELRGRGIGKALAERIIGDAIRLGYTKMRLDTVSTMTAAIRLYRSLGFTEIGKYRVNPLPNALFLELDLSARQS